MDYHVQWPRRALLRRAEALAARLAVPREPGGVELAGYHTSGPIVAATINGAERPDVADLGRVLRLEGGPRWRAGWGARFGPGGRGFLVLTIRVDSPVRCTFRLRYDLVRERLALDALARWGRVLVTPVSPLADPDAAVVMGHVFAFPTHGLAAFLASLDHPATHVPLGGD